MTIRLLACRAFACAAALACLAAPALAQPAPAPGRPGPCGASVLVQRGDTLSAIAERCDVSERAIVSANPGVDGSRDLRVGMRLALQPTAEGTIGQLRSLAEGAGDALAGVARDIGSSVDDLLARNPDLRDRLRSLGDSLTGTATDVSGARVTLAPERGETGTSVTLGARGLPVNREVVIGGGPPRQAWETLGRARTGADGSLTMTVAIPDWAGEAERFVFVIADPEGTWRVRSAPFAITGRRL